MSLRLPKEIERYVASLMQIYKIKGKTFLQQILANAIITFKSFISNFPKSRLIDKVIFQLGNTYYKQANYK